MHKIINEFKLSLSVKENESKAKEKQRYSQMQVRLNTWVESLESKINEMLITD